MQKLNILQVAAVSVVSAILFFSQHINAAEILAEPSNLYASYSTQFSASLEKMSPSKLVLVGQKTRTFTVDFDNDGIDDYVFFDRDRQNLRICVHRESSGCVDFVTDAVDIVPAVRPGGGRPCCD